jgi:diguanylate cyclase (GGDEF)-like protein
LAFEDHSSLPSDQRKSHADADERSSNRGQAAADREHAAADRDEHAADREESQIDAQQRTSNRTQAAGERESAASDRELTASDRDLSHADSGERSSDRAHAAADREHAAADREYAVIDRLAAGRDQEHMRAELRHAQLDPLTGALGRGIGLVIIEREIIRARRGNGLLVLAYVDVDEFKQVNDQDGHAAGDVLLRDIADAIQKHMRPYDTLVRLGGDEFVCALGNCTSATAHDRFRRIRSTLARTQRHASISVGYAELQADETLQQLTERADHALYAAKRSR